MARKVTIKAFEAWIADEANVADVLSRIAGGLTLQKASVAVKQPYTCLHGYFHSTPEREELYSSARKAWADLVQDEAMAIVDTAKPDKGHVAKAKLQAETRHNQAKAYHRERWGERLQVEKHVTVGADEALLGKAADLLVRISRREKLIEGAELVGEASPPVALPAARPPADDPHLP